MDEELADVVAVEGTGWLTMVEMVVAPQPASVGFEGGGEVAQFALGAEHVDEGYGFGHGPKIHAGDHSTRKRGICWQVLV